MLTAKEITDNKEFLDKVAIVTLESYLHRSSPKNFADSMSLARVAYKNALGMLEVRENSLLSLAKEAGLYKKKEE